MRTQLPDCRGHRDTFTLSADERRELVRRIAEEGPGAIDAFIKEREAEDSLIARKVAKLRDELLARAEALRRRLAESFGQREEELEAEYRARLAELQSERENIERDAANWRGLEGARLTDALRRNPILGIALGDTLVARPPLWRRILAVLVRIVRIILFPLIWLLRLITGRKRRAAHTANFILPGGTPGAALSRAGSLYMSDAGFRGAVRARLRAAPPGERIRRAWERLLGVEDYETLAQKAMAQMMAEEAARAKNDDAERERDLARTLETLAEREREAARTHDDAERDLETQRAREAAELERALRDMPEQEIKEAIVDELQAAGLLRTGDDGLMPTLQFMDTFAALVYDEEMKGSGRGRASATGDYAEGEGHYRREPLRSAMETSRMDIPATVLRARSRHPHVKHLTDDDVVIYREERESRLHVILVVDQSGSMEDNHRMDAAKRAALALHHAVKQKNRRNKVDVLLMDTSITPASLRDVWQTTPRGFTNHGAALSLVREACQRDRGARTLVYFITDGLPEAHTVVKDGRSDDVAGHPDKAMKYAKQQARLLAREANVVGFVMLLLEPEDELFVDAARELAAEAGGRVIPVDPTELAGTLLRQFEAPVVATK